MDTPAVIGRRSYRSFFRSNNLQNCRPLMCGIVRGISLLDVALDMPISSPEHPQLRNKHARKTYGFAHECSFNRWDFHVTQHASAESGDPANPSGGKLVTLYSRNARSTL